MELRHLRYFVAAVQEGSLQGAAQRLNVAQPALSRRVRDLEAELGCDLLERGARGVTPTRAGLAFYRDAIAMLDGLSETVQTARRLGLEQDRAIRMGFAPAASRKYGFVQKALSGFTGEHPEAGVAYALGGSVQLTNGLRGGDFDLALIYDLHAATTRVAERLIHRERYILAAYPGHRLAVPGPVRPAELAGEELVWLSRPDVDDNANPLMQHLRRHGIDPVIAHLTNDPGEQLDLVSARAGICLTPASTMLIVPEGQLVFRSLPDFAMALDFRLAWQAEPASSAAAALLDQFHKAIDAHRGDIAAGLAHRGSLDGHPLFELPESA